MAKSLRGVAKVAAVNCDTHQALCSPHNVQGYPTVKAFVPQASGARARSVDFNGERSAKAIHDWALGLLPNHVVSLRDRKGLDAFLATCGGSAGGHKAGAKAGGKDGAAASWALCVVLVTDKPETPPLYRALSGAYKGKVSFGEIRTGSGASKAAPELVSALLGKVPPGSASQRPLLVSVCNGDLEVSELYSGKLKSEALGRHLDGYAGGGKCRKAIRLDASTDFSAMSSSALKALLKERQLDCRGCTEKGDFVRRLQEYVKGQ